MQQLVTARIKEYNMRDKVYDVRHVRSSCTFTTILQDETKKFGPFLKVVTPLYMVI